MFTDHIAEADPQIPHLPPKDVIHRIYRDVSEIRLIPHSLMLIFPRSGSAMTRPHTRQTFPPLSPGAAGKASSPIVRHIRLLSIHSDHPCHRPYVGDTFVWCLMERTSSDLLTHELGNPRSSKSSLPHLSLTYVALPFDRSVKPDNGSIIAAGAWCPGKNELQTIR